MRAIRSLRPETDAGEWLRMRLALWPEGSAAEYRAEMDSLLADETCAVLVADRGSGGLCGFAEASTRRDHVPGCSTSPVAYLEGWWVDPDVRRAGVGRALVAAVERWATARGLTELGSDTWLDNEASAAAHAALGFATAERLVHFHKRLDV